MSTSDIITGQFVRISQTPASVGDRIVARIIDMVILVIYLIASCYVIAATVKFDTDVTSWFLPLVLILPAMGYSFLCETFYHGQTLGKYIMHIRVISIDGSTPTIGSLLMRWMLLIIDLYFSCVGLLFIACSRKRQRLGDIAAGTMVIKIANYSKMHISLDEFYYARRDYKPVYPEARQLSLGQADVIRKALYGTDFYNVPQIDLLSAKVQHFLKILPRDDDNIKFLTTLLHDYLYYTMELI